MSRIRSPAIKAISGLTTCTSRLIDSPHCELSKDFARFVSSGGASIVGCPCRKQGQEQGIARDKVASASFNPGPKDLYLSFPCRFWRQKVRHEFAGIDVRSNARGGRAAAMTIEDPGFWLAVVQIIWIDILLSGDNAVVIALACRKLPPSQRMWGIVLGTLVAITLRVLFTGVVTQLMTIPYVKLVGGVLLFWIAVKLLGGEENGREGHIEAVDSLWKAIRIVAIADVVMSLDNIIAVAAASRGSYAL